MLAVRLAETGARTVLIERAAVPGLGVAYSTTCDAHLLNVRSGRMSARADRPDDFVAWLAENHPDCADREGFVPRRLYGAYVRDRFEAARRAQPDRIEVVQGEAVALETAGVRLADGRVLTSGAVVLATGNPPPRTARSRTATRALISDPWAPGALEAIRPSDEVILIGSGLTMADMVLMLDDRGWLGRALVVSRRGLTPRAHDLTQPDVERRPPPPSQLSERLGWARKEARSDGWGVMMDRLRPLNADLWRGLEPDQRRRFLRHLRPWWDVHRHRMAPQPAARLDSLVAQGRLDVRAGRIEAIATRHGRVEVAWRPRGQASVRTARADALIDCTGPGHNPSRSAEPLIRALVENGQARPDALGLGLDVDSKGRLINAGGRASDRVLVLGPPALAAFWETVAVPDIRERIEDVVARLAPG